MGRAVASHVFQKHCVIQLAHLTIIHAGFERPPGHSKLAPGKGEYFRHERKTTERAVSVERGKDLGC